MLIRLMVGVSLEVLAEGRSRAAGQILSREDVDAGLLAGTSPWCSGLVALLVPLSRCVKHSDFQLGHTHGIA